MVGVMPHFLLLFASQTLYFPANQLITSQMNYFPVMIAGRVWRCNQQKHSLPNNELIWEGPSSLYYNPIVYSLSITHFSCTKQYTFFVSLPTIHFCKKNFEGGRKLFLTNFVEKFVCNTVQNLDQPTKRRIDFV